MKIGDAEWDILVLRNAFVSACEKSGYAVVLYGNSYYLLSWHFACFLTGDLPLIHIWRTFLKINLLLPAD